MEYDEPVYYCTECMSLDIRDGEDGCMRCHSCGAGPSKTDVLPDIWSWMRLYAKRYGKAPLEYRTPYDDLQDAYTDETEQITGEADAWQSGIRVMDVMQRNLKKRKYEL